MALPKHSIVVAVLLLAAPAPLAALEPDCAGIHDVSDFDGASRSDFVNLLTTVRVASGLTSPVHATSPPDGPAGPDDRLFIVEQPGRIRILDLPTGQLQAAPFLDITALVRDTGNEEGLLSIAFHPEYNTPGAGNEGLFFVFYTNNAGDNQVSRYAVGADPGDADEASAETVLAISHPTNSNHNGGQIAFGPDGALYIASGDGGGSCDSPGNAQNRNALLGKLLRLGVDSFPPYSTAGNPFDGPVAGADQVWAYGLRNPWRLAFDRLTGALYIGDVGQGQIEEIDCQPAASAGGENYGWDLYEGVTCPNPSCGGLPADCGSISPVAPIREYNHSTDGFSCSVTGGFVYRGCMMGDLRGSYFYADFCSDQIRSFRSDPACSFDAASEILRTADLATPGLTINDITSFGEDGRGEIYICDRGGEVFRILPVLSIMEVSGENAARFLATATGFVWENLRATSMHAIAAYKVYRSEDDPAGPFECVHQGPDPDWPEGDPQVPGPGEVFFYLVTAVDAAGVETRPGAGSDGTPPIVDTMSGCP
jgi:glucose/arabinose dehydrogenase